MAIWRGTSTVPTVGPEIHVKYKMLGGGDSYAGQAGEAVGLARMMLRQMLTVMQNGPMGLTVNQLQVLDYYFVLGGNPISAQDFDIIRTTLTHCAMGLNGGGLTLKVTMSGSANGYVNMHDNRMGKLDKLRAKFKSRKDGWTPGVDVDDGTFTHYGSIHLDSDRMDDGPELAAKTVIHEATHKFASTTDFGKRGYTDDDSGLFRKPGLTKAEAFNNAESYARFVMMGFLFP